MERIHYTQGTYPKTKTTKTSSQKKRNDKVGRGKQNWEEEVRTEGKKRRWVGKKKSTNMAVGGRGGSKTVILKRYGEIGTY